MEAAAINVSEKIEEYEHESLSEKGTLDGFIWLVLNPAKTYIDGGMTLETLPGELSNSIKAFIAKQRPLF